MTTILRPAYSVVLGGQRWTAQLSTVEVRLAMAPMVDVAMVRLPAAAPVSADLDDPVEIELDGGEGADSVFTGSVHTIRRELSAITVTALNGGGRLAQHRPATTYEQITAANLIRSLCSDVEVSTGELDTGVSLAYYAADPGRNALEHIARVAGWGGALVRFDADGRLGSTVVNAVQAELALRYGRELLALDQARTAAPVTSFVVAGEAGASSHSAAPALRATTDFFGGSRPDGPSATSRWRFEPALRTAAAASTAGAALDRSYRASRSCAGFTAMLVPKLRPGTVLEIQDLPDGLDGGPYWVDRVSHRMSAAGALTRVRLRLGGDTFDPAALLAGALSALL